MRLSIGVFVTPRGRARRYGGSRRDSFAADRQIRGRAGPHPACGSFAHSALFPTRPSTCWVTSRRPGSGCLVRNRDLLRRLHVPPFQASASRTSNVVSARSAAINWMRPARMSRTAAIGSGCRTSASGAPPARGVRSRLRPDPRGAPGGTDARSPDPERSDLFWPGHGALQARGSRRKPQPQLPSDPPRGRRPAPLPQSLRVGRPGADRG